MNALTLGLLLAAASPGDTVKLYDDLGDHHHPITTEVPETQAYFDQGLRLQYGFNHAEAIRSYQRGAELDPGCAMCYWGVALALGPNINAEMDEAAGAAAWEAISRALELSSRVSPKEQAYIEALAKRYGPDPLANRDQRNRDWAEAMSRVARQYPDDDDAAVLAGAAQMNLSPWDYWVGPGEPKANGRQALEFLRPVTERSPRNVGACHYFIHLVEEHHPTEAVDCAERIPDLMPGAGHIVHMPGHIYIRVGRYADAVERNVHAAHADEAHMGDFAPDGLYLMAYYPHNYHFLWFAASMARMGDVAVDAARKTASRVDPDAMRMHELRMLQHFYVTPLWALVRFSRWDDVLAEPKPADDLIYPQGAWHYARALAFVAKGDLTQARKEQAMVARRAAEIAEDEIVIWDLNPASTILRVAELTVDAEIRAAAGDFEGAEAALAEALELEQTLTYDEPPTWHLPVNQTRGRLMLAAGKADVAAESFRADLDRFPENAWSLEGLAESLVALGQTAEAEAVRVRLQKALEAADASARTAHRHNED